MTEKIKLLVADDHPAVRDGLCRLLEDEAEMEVIGRAGDGNQTIALAKELKPDVVLVDVSMPGINGIEATKQIKQACPDIAVLIVSGYNYQSFVIASLQAGASGFLLKNTSVSELINAIRMVRNGKAIFDLKAASNIFLDLSTGKGQEQIYLNPLHEREREVLCLLAKGISNKEIATKMDISERTVQTHLVNICRKLGASSRTKAVLIALKRGWLTLDDLP